MFLFLLNLLMLVQLHRTLHRQSLVQLLGAKPIKLVSAIIPEKLVQTDQDHRNDDRKTDQRFVVFDRVLDVGSGVALEFG